MEKGRRGEVIALIFLLLVLSLAEMGVCVLHYVLCDFSRQSSSGAGRWWLAMARGHGLQGRQQGRQGVCWWAVLIPPSSFCASSSVSVSSFLPLLINL